MVSCQLSVVRPSAVDATGSQRRHTMHGNHPQKQSRFVSLTSAAVMHRTQHTARTFHPSRLTTDDCKLTTVN